VIQIYDYFRADAQQKNENLEFERNKERFTFLKVIYIILLSLHLTT